MGEFVLNKMIFTQAVAITLCFSKIVVAVNFHLYDRIPDNNRHFDKLCWLCLMEMFPSAV